MGFCNKALQWMLHCLDGMLHRPCIFLFIMFSYDVLHMTCVYNDKQNSN